MILSFRVHCAALVVLCTAFLGAALYAEHVLLLLPCPLCVLQRVAFIGIGLVALAGLIHGPRGFAQRLYAAVATLFGVAGVGIAGYHVWLQQLPADQVPSCSGMSLGFMLQAMPWQQVLSKVFTASGECAKVDWVFLGLSMPAWSLGWFALFTALLLWLLFRRNLAP